MTELRPNHRSTRRRKPRGLRTRLWLATLGGAIASSLATGCVIAAIQMAGTAMDSTVLAIGLGAASLFGLCVGFLCGLWLVWGVSNPLRAIQDALTTGTPLEAEHWRPWGEIGDITDGVRDLIENERSLRRSQSELGEIYETIDRARDAVEHWVATERWAPLRPTAGPLAPLAESLDRGFERGMHVLDQNLEAARVVHEELRRVVDESRASAELAEHGYVEATALMTTVREIGRLAAEIQQATQDAARAGGPEPPPELPAWREEAARAIGELVDVSGESVEFLGAGLLKVHEIAAQVQLVSNRATLIALNAVVSGGRGEPRPASGDSATAEMKQLARDVRAVTERVSALSDEVSDSVRTATERMRAVREHVSERLEQLPVPALPARAPVIPPAPIAHWLERLREMVQDAARKGERLSESQERVSSDTQRLTRRLEEEARDLEGLLIRLTPPADTLRGEAAAPGLPRFRVVDAATPLEDADEDSPGGELRT